MTARTLPRWLELGSYLFVALGAVLPALLTAGHVIGDGVDLFGTFWFYWWIQDCLATGTDPSFTQLFFYPLGKNIFAHTGNNFVDALIAQPFQYILGYPRYQPVFIGFMLLGNALCFRPLARYLLGTGVAAWGATLLWELAPYTLFELLTGRLTQAFLWFVPLAIYHFLRIGEGRWRDPILAGVWTGVVGWTYWFMGYFVAMGFVWLAIAQLIRGEHPRLRMAIGWVVAGGVCLAVIAPAYSQMAALAADDLVPGLSGGGGHGPAEVANNVSTYLHGYILMESEGHPMFTNITWGGGLLLFALFGRDRLRWLGLTAFTLLFAIGAVWNADNPVVMPHYMWAYNHLPFFDRLWFPYRMLGLTFLAVAIGIGTLIKRLEGWRYAAAIPVVLVLLTMAEQHRHLAYPLIHRDLTPPQVYYEIGRYGGALIEAPVGISRTSIAFQPVHGQPTFGGMGENASVLWPSSYRRRLGNTFIQFLKYITRDPEHPRNYREGHLTNLKAEGFRWVVLDRQLVDAEIGRWSYGKTAQPAKVESAPFDAQDVIIAKLGEPWAVEGPLVVWDLLDEAPTPEGLAPTEENLTTRSWDPETMPEYERHLRDIGRMPSPQRRTELNTTDPTK